MTRSNICLLALFLASLVMAGCGQKGALYLPDNAAEKSTEKQQSKKPKQ